MHRLPHDLCDRSPLPVHMRVSGFFQTNGMVSLVTRPNMEAQRQHAPKSSPWKPWRGVHALCLLATLLVALAAAPASDSFRFVVLGDRTGGAQPGIYEQVWQVAAAEGPAFVVTVGDTIEGLNDATVETEWEAVEHILAPNRKDAPTLPLGITTSGRRSRRERFGSTHGMRRITPLTTSRRISRFSNSRSDQFSSDELRFLEQDLQAHAAQPVKFIVSHRPSWLMDVMFANPNFALHRLAKKYGVQYVIAGHFTKCCKCIWMASRTSRWQARADTYARPRTTQTVGFSDTGWWKWNGRDVKFQIKELKPPYGLGRVTRPEDWESRISRTARVAGREVTCPRPSEQEDTLAN